MNPILAVTARMPGDLLSDPIDQIIPDGFENSPAWLVAGIATSAVIGVVHYRDNKLLQDINNKILSPITSELPNEAFIPEASNRFNKSRTRKLLTAGAGALALIGVSGMASGAYSEDTEVSTNDVSVIFVAGPESIKDDIKNLDGEEVDRAEAMVNATVSARNHGNTEIIIAGSTIGDLGEIENNSPSDMNKAYRAAETYLNDPDNRKGSSIKSAFDSVNEIDNDNQVIIITHKLTRDLNSTLANEAKEDVHRVTAIFAGSPDAVVQRQFLPDVEAGIEPGRGNDLLGAEDVYVEDTQAGINSAIQEIMDRNPLVVNKSKENLDFYKYLALISVAGLVVTGQIRNTGISLKRIIKNNKKKEK